MTERELAINRDLHALDEAHRLNRLSRAEYRLRRRRVLQSAHAGDGVVTARKSIGSSGSTTRPRTEHTYAASGRDTEAAGEALTSLLSMRPAIAWKHWLAFLAVVIVLGLVVAWLLLGDG